MRRLTDFTLYADAQREFSSARLWDLFDGDRQRMNIAHECVDRFAAATPERIAIRVAHADGTDEAISFGALAAASSRFAHHLLASGLAPGERVAIMLDPSFAFYVTLFGAMKAGVVCVPLFTLFGADGVRLRVDDCHPRLLLASAEKAAQIGDVGVPVFVVDAGFETLLESCPPIFKTDTRTDDLALVQYTSGTTREVPEAIRHTHRAIVLVTVAALYGTGVRPGDSFFCPSSPAWGHGLWHGTLAPLGLGVSTGTMSGRFDAERLLRALRDYAITNLSAAPTHYRMIRNSGAAERYPLRLEKASFTGEPMDSETLAFSEALFGTTLRSMYGTTEVGVPLVNYPGAADFTVKPGSLGKPVPGMRVEIHDPAGRPCEPGEIGEIVLWRRDRWVPTRDRGSVDAGGYFYHAGRADDVIISAGWTIGATEVEDALLRHPAVREAAVIGVADKLRGQVVKAVIVSREAGGEVLAKQLQDFVRTRLSGHEYPRVVEFVDELPKTPAGKVNRKALRDREAARAVEKENT